MGWDSGLIQVVLLLLSLGHPVGGRSGPCRTRGGCGAARRAGRCPLVEKNLKKTQNSKNTVDSKKIVVYTKVITNKEATTMKATELAKSIWEKSGISQKKLAVKIGVKYQQTILNMFNAKQGMRVDNFVKIMNALGYEVQVRNKVTDEIIIVTAEVESCDTGTDE